MKQRIYFYGLLGLMGACGAAVAMGNLAPDVSLESAREIWADVLRDVDEFGLHATRIPVHKEMQVGADMARQSVWGAEDGEAAKYVAAVGQGLVGNVNRKAMRYQFHVIRSREVNAFALPGGQIYVLSGMLDFLHSEAELAAILGHEISHVDLRHCVERYQYQLALKKIGAGDAGPLVEIAHGLVAIGYSQDQELEADASGSGWRSRPGTIRTQRRRCSIGCRRRSAKARGSRRRHRWAKRGRRWAGRSFRISGRIRHRNNGRDSYRKWSRRIASGSRGGPSIVARRTTSCAWRGASASFRRRSASTRRVYQTL